MIAVRYAPRARPRLDARDLAVTAILQRA